jgi:hypothetical protein
LTPAQEFEILLADYCRAASVRLNESKRCFRSSSRRAPVEGIVVISS